MVSTNVGTENKILECKKSITLEDKENDTFNSIIALTRKRKWANAEEMAGNKKIIRTPVHTSNRFAVLEDMETEQTASGSQNNTSTSNSNLKKFPPLIMHGNIQDHKKFISLIKDIVKEKFHIKYNEDSVSVHLQTLLDYEHLKRTWKERGIHFHTYTRKDEKRRVYVLNGLHSEITIEDIQNELKEAGINTITINRMRGTTRSLFMVTVSATINLKMLQTKIKHLCYTKVTWCNYITKQKITQCHRCQEWGHSATNCYAESACLKCAGKHHTKDCSKPRSEPAKCVNCGEGHPANATNCRAYINRLAWLESLKTNKERKTHIQNKQNKAQIIEMNAKNMDQFPELTQTKQHKAPTTQSIIPASTSNVWFNKSTKAAQDHSKQDTNAAEIAQLVELTTELKKLNESINIPRMLESVKQLNIQLATCNSNVEKFQYFVQFCQNIE